MGYISGVMPKSPDKKRVEAHLLPDKFEQFEAIAKANHWSNKKLAEIIIDLYLEDQKKGKKPPVK
jgi:hypothetical protein